MYGKPSVNWKMPVNSSDNEIPDWFAKDNHPGAKQQLEKPAVFVAFCWKGAGTIRYPTQQI